MATLVLILVLIFLLIVTATALVGFYLRVPYVPSNRKAIRAVVQSVRLLKSDRVYELGCGDGRLAFALNQAYGCHVTGFELAPLPYLWARLKHFFCKKDRVHFLMQDFLTADLHQANYLYCYLMPSMLKKLAAKIEREHLHVTVITHSFAIHSWQPQKVIPKNVLKRTPIVYVYKT